ncbi:unnamed protein product [Caenorhabditis nigoni]
MGFGELPLIFLFIFYILLYSYYILLSTRISKYRFLVVIYLKKLTMQQAAAVSFNPSRPLPVEFYANELNRHILGTVTNITKEQVNFIKDIVKNIKASHTYFLEISKIQKSQVHIDELQKRLEDEENENSTLKEQVMELNRKLCKMESEIENQVLDFGNKDRIKIKAKTASDEMSLGNVFNVLLLLEHMQFVEVILKTKRIPKFLHQHGICAQHWTVCPYCTGIDLEASGFLPLSSDRDERDPFWDRFEGKFEVVQPVVDAPAPTRQDLMLPLVILTLHLALPHL